jgi:beta-glucanase (GH16 family)
MQLLRNINPALPALLLFPLLFGQKAGKPVPAPPWPVKPGDWVLTFDEEFDGRELDLSKWITHDPWGQVRDRQLQAYVPEALTISGGQLHIGARHLAADEAGVRYDGKEREYVSGVISTFGIFSQTYGRFEIRCRIPAGRGLRAGFLLLPTPSGTLPAIDVFETVGSPASKVFFANHWGTEQTERSFGDSFTGPDLSAGFPGSPCIC